MREEAWRRWFSGGKDEVEVRIQQLELSAGALIAYQGGYTGGTDSEWAKIRQDIRLGRVSEPAADV